MSRDADLLREARNSITGEQSAGPRNAAYAIYVAVIAAGTYGVPAAQAFFRFLDPQWLAAHLGGPGALALGGVVLVLTLAFAHRAGRVRGPVVPELPYLDHVASSPLDRAVVLRRWWRLALLGCAVGGLLLGVVIGAGMALASLTGPVAIAPGGLLGALVGAVVAATWLHGQVRAWPGSDHGPGLAPGPRRSLRALHLTLLRTQSARSVTVGGAVLAGDLRAARLDVAAPTTRGRTIRLRGRGPIRTVVSRDWLGLRRAPGRGVAGLVLTAAAAYGLVHAAAGTPSLVTVLSLLLAYFGLGAWSEGLRLHGDNAGTPPLLGLSPMLEARAHLVVPGVLYALTVSGVGLVTLVRDHVSPAALLWALALGSLVMAGQVMAAFRGLPPMGVFSPRGGMSVMVLWQSIPLLVPIICGTAATAAFTSRAPLNGVLVLGATAYGAALYGARRVGVLFDAHRA